MKKVIFIILGLFVVGVIIFLVVTRGSILNNGVPYGENPASKIEFTEGGLGEFPLYPNSEQSTDSAGITVPDDMKQIVNTPTWKRNITSDSRERVESWYDEQMPTLGYQKGEPRESGLVIYTTGDTRAVFYFTEVDGKTNIIVGVGKE